MALAPKNKNGFRLVLIGSGILISCLVLSVIFFSNNQIFPGLIVLIVPFLIASLGFIFARPVVGFITLLFANYFAIGLSRYISGPLGLSVDGLLILTWLAVIFSQFNQKLNWKDAWNELTFVAIIWFGYSIFQFFNPEAVSKEAWFYAMRGISLYMLLTLPLVFLILNKPKQLHLFLQIWAWLTIIAVLKGIMQKFIGPDPWEDQWLDAGGGKTHRLAQGLRIFSFFSDSATYGGSMGFSGVVFSILALYTNQTKQKIFYLAVGLLAFYALLISGTRGALAVPFGGFFFYAIISKRFKILLLIIVMLVGAYSFLKFTTIGESVYEIRRFREAVDSDNASLAVRQENQQKFAAYLTDRPFGGGIGSAGNWGLRFSSGTFLAETPPDGWYVQIWAEQGIVGLILYLSILVFIIVRCSYIVMFKLKNKYYIGIASAFTSGIFGVMVASYSSGALGQMPNGIIIYTALAFILMMEKWEKNDLIMNEPLSS
jgi:uncharacterized protein (UPF0333 family)